VAVFVGEESRTGTVFAVNASGRTGRTFSCAVPPSVCVGHDVVRPFSVLTCQASSSVTHNDLLQKTTGASLPG